MRCSVQLRGQSMYNIVNIIQLMQSKALRIVCLKNIAEPPDPLYTNNKILK